MNDPYGLEPKNGDFVAYIQSLQEGKIRNLGALQSSVPASASDGTSETESAYDSLAREAAAARRQPEQRQSSSSQRPAARPASVSVPQQIPGETPSDRIRRRAAEMNRQQGGKALGALSVFVGFACFAIGSILASDMLVVIGMLISVAGFGAAARK